MGSGISFGIARSRAEWTSVGPIRHPTEGLVQWHTNRASPTLKGHLGKDESNTQLSECNSPLESKLVLIVSSFTFDANGVVYIGRDRVGHLLPPERTESVPETHEGRKVREILKSKGKLITLSQMNTGRAARVLGPVAGYAEVMLVDCDEFVATISTGGSSRSIPLGRLEVSYDNARQRLELQERPS